MNDQAKGRSSFGERDGSATLSGNFLSASHQSDPKVPEKNRVFRQNKDPLRWTALSTALKRLSKKQREALFWVVLLISGGGVLLFSNDGAKANKEPQAIPLSLRVPKGKRAYPLELEHSLPLSVGDRFDLFGRRDLEGSYVSLIEDILVLEVYPPRQVVVALNAEEIGWVEMAVQTGKLKVAVRGPDEGAATRARHPYRRRSAKSRPSSISIWED